MPVIQVLLTFLTGGDSVIEAAIAALYMAGIWRMLEKSGVKGWWALIPGGREYQLACCAGRESEGQALDLLQGEDNPAIAELREKELGKVMTVRELKTALDSSETFAALKKEELLEGITVGDLLEALDAAGLTEKYGDVEIGGTVTVGEAVDFLAANPDVQARRGQEITVSVTLGKLLDLAGEENVKTFLEEKAAAVSYNPDYDCTVQNIMDYWGRLVLFVLAFALLAMVTLEFIDKDKR